MSQISIADVSVEFGATTLFEHVTLTIDAGTRWGIVGRNGSGKTTLFKLITRELLPSSGAVASQPGLRIAVLDQHRDFGSAATVWDAAAGPFSELITLERALTAHTENLSQLGERVTERDLDRYAQDLERFERGGGYTFSARVDAVLHGLGFEPEHARTQPVAQLSGGERGRLGLVRQLVAPADVLLLDEPTNHLDLKTISWLEQYLRNVAESVLLISHDRIFLDNIVDHVFHFDGGTATTYPGNYSAFVQQHTERQLTQQRSFEQQQRIITREEDYIRRNIAGQNSRQAKGRRTRLERVPRLSPPASAKGTMALRLATSERSGDQVVIAEHAQLSVSGRILIRDLNTVVRRGDVVGFVGLNGAGKSTLLRALTGEQSIDCGVLRLGGAVHAAYYRQDLAQVPLGHELYDIIAALRPTWGRGGVLTHLARFGFTGDDVLRTSDTLSGGERARLALAMIMLAHANLLLLDEPTNHLDVESIEALEDAITEYDGTVILISHDRAMLRALATRVWVLRDGEVTHYNGTFVEWEEVEAERERALAVNEADKSGASRGRDQPRARSETARKRDARANDRTIKRRLDDTEAEVTHLESRIALLTQCLANFTLYATPEGAKHAMAIRSELTEAKRALDDALARWERLAGA